MQVYQFDKFVKLTFPDTEIVDGGILHEKSRFLLAGDTGLGKSYLSLQIAFESARGEPWLGIWPMHRALRTMLVQIEVADSVFHRRCERLAVRQVIKNIPLWVVSIEDFVLVEGINELVDLITQHKIELLILDPLYKIHEGDENAVHTVKPTQRIIDRLRRDHNICVGFNHHIRKPQIGERPTINLIRGSSAWAGWVDTVILATPGPNDTVRLHLVKARNREEALPRQAYVLAWQKPGKFFTPILDDTVGNVGLILQAIEELSVDGVARQSAVRDWLINQGWSRSQTYRGIAELVELGEIIKEDRDLRFPRGGEPDGRAQSGN